MAFPLKKEVVADVAPFIISARKACHIGQLFGQISNGGGQLALDDNYAIRFVRDGSDFVKVELLQYGLGTKASNQSWQRTKTVVEKAEPPKRKEVKELVVNENIESEELW
jgi:hypothetical protein